jgi:hypothetical protein
MEFVMQTLRERKLDIMKYFISMNLKCTSKEKETWREIFNIESPVGAKFYCCINADRKMEFHVNWPQNYKGQMSIPYKEADRPSINMSLDKDLHKIYHDFDKRFLKLAEEAYKVQKDYCDQELIAYNKRCETAKEFMELTGQEINQENPDKLWFPTINGVGIYSPSVSHDGTEVDLDLHSVPRLLAREIIKLIMENKNV